MSQSFGALGVSAEGEQSLAARGIVEPFRIQSLVVPDALQGRDILGKAPTGSGKTLAFELPIVDLVSAGAAAPAGAWFAPPRPRACPPHPGTSRYGCRGSSPSSKSRKAFVRRPPTAAHRSGRR